MISIIQRYLAAEILKSTVATTLILFVILMSNTLGAVLSDISEGSTPADALFPVLLGQSVHILSKLLPLGFFLGIVFAFGRLYKDHELVVLQACGFGYTHLYRVVLLLLIPMLAITAWSSIWLSADMLQHAQKIVDEKENVHEFQQLKDGQFNADKKNEQIFFMQSMSVDRREIYDVVIARQGKQEDVVETAKRGRHTVDEASGDLFLELGPGIRYQGTAGEADFSIVEFERHGILLEKKPMRVSSLNPDEKSFAQIRASSDRDDQVEFWWRMGVPISMLVLSLVAVPLSYIAPRQGRYGKIGFSILIFIVYLHLLGTSKSAIEKGDLPLWLNFWWIHAMFVVLALLLLARRTRFPMLLGRRSKD